MIFEEYWNVKRAARKEENHWSINLHMMNMTEYVSLLQASLATRVWLLDISQITTNTALGITCRVCQKTWENGSSFTRQMKTHEQSEQILKLRPGFCTKQLSAPYMQLALQVICWLQRTLSLPRKLKLLIKLVSNVHIHLTS